MGQLDIESIRFRRSPKLLVGAASPPVALRGRRSVVSAIERLEDFALANPSLRADARRQEKEKGVGSLLPERPGGCFAQKTPDPFFLARQNPAPQPGGDLAGFVRRTTLDAYTTAEQLADLAANPSSGAAYPANELAGHLQLVARLIKADLGTRVFYTVHSGYDTHAAQLPVHARLLRELAGALRAFIDDLSAAGLADRVLVMTFSEFGRRVQENGSAGTDHGTAGPVFLAGGKVQGGLHGSTPSLSNLEAGDLKMSIDFRQVYATILEHWLELPAKMLLNGSFQPLRVLS